MPVAQPQHPKHWQKEKAEWTVAGLETQMLYSPFELQARMCYMPLWVVMEYLLSQNHLPLSAFFCQLGMIKLQD